MCIYDFCVQIKITTIGLHFRFYLGRCGNLYKFINLSLNLQFVAATTTEAATAGPTSPATVRSETTSATITTGPVGGTIFLHIPLWNHDLFLHHSVLPKIHLLNMSIIVTVSCVQCSMYVLIHSWFWLSSCVWFVATRGRTQHSYRVDFYHIIDLKGSMLYFIFLYNFLFKCMLIFESCFLYLKNVFPVFWSNFKCRPW